MKKKWEVLDDTRVTNQGPTPAAVRKGAANNPNAKLVKSSKRKYEVKAYGKDRRAKRKKKKGATAARPRQTNGRPKNAGFNTTGGMAEKWQKSHGPMAGGEGHQS